MLDRYGDAVELDLAFKTPYRLREFLDGTETLNTLINLVGAFSRMPNSYLAAAQATDVEAYRAANPEGTRPRKVNRAPDITEVGHVESLLMGIVELLQQVAHWSAASAPKGSPKPKVKKLPRPLTAAQLAARQEQIDGFNDIESRLRFERTNP